MTSFFALLRRAVTLPLLVYGVLGCSTAALPAEDDVAALTSSRADTGCGIVLRDVQLAHDRWVGEVDVDAAMVNASAAEVLVKVRRYSPSAPVGWHVARAERVAADAEALPIPTPEPAGFVRYRFSVRPEELGLEASAMQTAHVELIPYLRTPTQDLYDHNRTHENYVMNGGMGVDWDVDACPARDSREVQDRSCNVVLRKVAPALGPHGEPIVEDRFLVWQGELDVSPSLVASGAAPGLRWSAKGERAFAAATPAGHGDRGMLRYAFRMVSDITAESPTARTTLVHVIAAAKTTSGEMVLDYNSREGEHVLDANANDWRVQSTGDVCR